MNKLPGNSRGSVAALSSFGLLFALPLLISSSPGSAEGAPIRIDVVAVVEDVYDMDGWLQDDIHPADTVYAYYVYDSNITDVDSRPNVGLYPHTASPATIAIAVAGDVYYWEFRTDSTNVQNSFFVADSLLSGGIFWDRYNYRSLKNVTYKNSRVSALKPQWTEIDLLDDTHSALDGDDLPLEAPTLSAWTGALVTVFGNGWYIFATIVSAVQTSATGVGVGAAPTLLGSARPNPSGGATAIPLLLAHDERVAAEVFDVAGRRVRTLASGMMTAGEHVLSWDGLTGTGSRSPSGVYFLRVRTPTASQTRKIVLMR